MELKSLIIIDNEMRSLCFNRTFMELKWEIMLEDMPTATVLIVPLWN